MEQNGHLNEVFNFPYIQVYSCKIKFNMKSIDHNLTNEKVNPDQHRSKTKRNNDTNNKN